MKPCAESITLTAMYLTRFRSLGTRPTRPCGGCSFAVSTRSIVTELQTPGCHCELAYTHMILKIGWLLICYGICVA
jgi:hypothetical protein